MREPISGARESGPGGKELPQGTRLEEFVIERVLGSGGFGITYLARDVSLNRQVVIKENLPSQFAHRDTTSLTVHAGPGREDQENFRWSLENFSREGETLASLRHPGIVPVLRRFEAFGTAYFVMPYIEGTTLDVLLRERQEADQPFTEIELRGLLERVLDALGYLHDRGIYHRDIKPGNILITDEGLPVLIDFGSARQRLSERSMTVVESAGYTPSEQLQSRGNVGPWSDLYALAATLVKVTTGEAPPKAMDRMRNDPFLPLTERVELASKFSKDFLGSLDQALAVDEGERWQDAAAWHRALHESEFEEASRRNEDPRSGVGGPPPVIAGSKSVPRESASGIRAGEERDFELAPGVMMTMCWIPAGEFVMGSPAGEPGRREGECQYQVIISIGFWLAKTETTQAQWQAVMGSNPSHFRGDDQPIESVSWNDIGGPGGFIEKVNQAVATGGCRFSLPTEAQWEYACRAGSTGSYAGDLGQMAWYGENSGSRTHKVGTKRANAWGLHDMHGNVWEWCWDWYGNYSSGVAVDPAGASSGTARVVRGGGWYGNALDCRAAIRGNDYPTSEDNGIGFRLARSSVP